MIDSFVRPVVFFLIVQKRYMSMLPLISDLERVEMVKQRVEWALRYAFVYLLAGGGGYS